MQSFLLEAINKHDNSNLEHVTTFDLESARSSNKINRKIGIGRDCLSYLNNLILVFINLDDCFRSFVLK